MTWVWITDSAERIKQIESLEEGDYIKYYSDYRRYERFGIISKRGVVNSEVWAYWGNTLEEAKRLTDHNYMHVDTPTIKYYKKQTYRIFYKDGGGNND